MGGLKKLRGAWPDYLHLFVQNRKELHKLRYLVSVASLTQDRRLGKHLQSHTFEGNKGSAESGVFKATNHGHLLERGALVSAVKELLDG